MRRLILGLSVLLVSWQFSNADVSLGLDLSLRVESGDRSGNPGRDASWDHVGFKLGPSLILRLSSAWEVNPRVFVSYANDIEDFVEGDGDYDPSGLGEDIFGLGPACGVYYHFIDGGPFSLSVGPDLILPMYFGDQVFDFTVDLGLPVNVDLHLGEKIFVRMGFRVASLFFHYTAWDDADETREHTVGIHLKTNLVPAFGFYVNF